MSRTLVIGDIHGNAKALKQVLERSGANDDDIIIQLGDVADGWHEVPECVEMLIGFPKLIALRGNHDVWCYDWFEKGVTHHMWTSQGGQATIDAYVRTGLLADPHHRNFWKDQIDWYIDNQNRLFIHAGWDYTYMPPEVTVGNVSQRTLFELQAGRSVSSHGVNVAGSIARECHWDRDIYMGAKSAAVGKNGRFKALEQFHEVYIGHTSSQKSQVVNALNLWNLDTGAGWHGKLTIMDIDTKEYWQSDFASVLYPGQRGRG